MAADAQAIQAASFLAQGLDLADDPTQLAGDLREIERDADLTTYLVQFDSSVGPTAFLIYVYRLQDGETAAEAAPSGLARFHADVRLFETVAAHDTPGPRAVAHAQTDEYGFILATSPDVVRALRDDTALTDSVAAPVETSAIVDLAPVRQTAAADLLRLLRLANEQAARWLAAYERSRRAATERGEPAPFTPEETELALFLLDDRSIRDLLRTLDTLLTAARHQAAAAVADDS